MCCSGHASGVLTGPMGLGAQRSGKAWESKGAVEGKEQGPGVPLSFVRSETPVTWSNVCPQTCDVRFWTELTEIMRKGKGCGNENSNFPNKMGFVSLRQASFGRALHLCSSALGSLPFLTSFQQEEKG